METIRFLHEDKFSDYTYKEVIGVVVFLFMLTFVQ